MKNLIVLFSLLLVNQCYYSQSNTIPSKCFSVSESTKKSSKDSLLIVSMCDVLDFKFQIFNRWGEVYHTSYSSGKIDIFNITPKDQVQTGTKKKKNTTQVDNNFVEGQYIWIITYFEVSDVNRKHQKTENGTLYIFE
jgi:hypothetical protein